MNKPFLPSHIRSLMVRRDLLLSRLQARLDRDPSAYLVLCRRVRSLIRSRKRKVRAARFSKLQSLQNSGKPFWSAFSRLTSISKPSQLPDGFAKPDGSLSDGGLERLQVARDYCAALSLPAPHSVSHFPAPILQPIPSVRTERQAALISALNVPLRPGEIRQALFSLKGSAASGPDGIAGSLLKFGGTPLVDALFNLFEACWQCRRLPISFTEGYVSLLYKSGDSSLLDHYRGLSLVNTAAKTLEYVLKARLVPLTEESLHDAQAGFRPDRRCLDQQLLLLEIIVERRERSLPTFISFVDIRKAYDHVWKEGLWALLERMGVNGHMLDLIKQFTDRVSRRVRIDGDTSDPFQCFRGVPQGSVLSPLRHFR